MMRVAVVDLMCNSPYYSATLTRALRGAGLEAELASPHFYLEPELLDHYPRPPWLVDLVVHASRPRPLRLAVRAIEGSLNFARLLNRIRARDYQVVHVQWVPFEGRRSPFMSILRQWCDSTGTLLVLTAHNAVPHDATRIDVAGLRSNLDAAHLVIAQTQHVATELAVDIGTTVPIVVIPHGPLFSEELLPPRQEAAERLGSPSAPVVLFQGLIRRYKGVDLLHEAWPKVIAAFPSASLFVVGKVADSHAARDVEAIRQLPSVRVDDRFVSVPDMLDYYAVADVVAFPYRRISQSGALMTAAGLGRPTVVTPIDGFREQVSDLRSAVTADEVSGDAVARALITSLAQRDEMSAAAASDRSSIVSSPIGWPAVAATTLNAYRSVRAGRTLR